MERHCYEEDFHQNSGLDSSYPVDDADFFLSAQSAAESSGLSSKVTELMLGLINKVVPAFSSGLVDYAYLNHVVRKLAHFLLYLVLGLLSARALRKNGITGGSNWYWR